MKNIFLYLLFEFDFELKLELTNLSDPKNIHHSGEKFVEILYYLLYPNQI